MFLALYLMMALKRHCDQKMMTIIRFVETITITDEGSLLPSVIMNITDPSIQILAGPPDEATYETYSFR